MVPVKVLIYSYVSIVIGNWELPTKSDAKEGGKDYIAMNREGVRNGFIDSKVWKGVIFVANFGF